MRLGEAKSYNDTYAALGYLHCGDVSLTSGFIRVITGDGRRREEVI